MTGHLKLYARSFLMSTSRYIKRSVNSINLLFLFFGFVFSANGISPDPRKIASIDSATRPTNVSEVRSFLGMATYCAKFIPRFSDVSEPL